jgi:glycosyltransferase involved in cell wall biosynthesis
MKKIVLYIGNFSFPLGNAAGKRVYANGKLLKEVGFEVIFIGINKDGDSSESLEQTKKEYEGFTYYDFSYPKSNFEWINYKRVFNELKRLLINENIVENLNIVIYYGSPRLSLFNTQLIRYCKRQNIKVIADCVDWLTIKTDNVLFDFVKWADNTYQKSYANKHTDGVITITSYLSNYYKKNGCKTVIIPPLSPFKIEATDFKENEVDIKIITYAGVPFRKGKQVTDCKYLKDRIDKTIKLLFEVKKMGCNFIFNIYGFTKDEYVLAIPEQKLYIEELGESIIFHGTKSNKEVVDAVTNSDFTILIRDVNRDTSAGFPTKVSESISCGTPVITTNTSDLEDYIVQGQNGFFININTKSTAIYDVKKILELSREDIKMMKKNCAGSNIFYYKNYTEKMSEFIDLLYLNN